MKKTTRVMLLAAIGCFPAILTTGPAWAVRSTAVTGEISILQGYDSNVNRTETDEFEEWTTALTPTLSLVSKGESNSLDLSYSPSYEYNHRSNDSTFNHYLSLDANGALSQKMQLTLHDTYEKTDDSTLNRNVAQETTNGVNLTENRQRSRYWTNYFDINDTIRYASNSSLALGYNDSIFESDNPEDENFKRHSPYVSIIHELSQQWLADVLYSFTKGDFEQSDDSKNHSVEGRLTYRLTPMKAIYGLGEYSTTDYDGMDIDYYITGGMLGYRQQINQQTAYDLAAGYSTIQRDNGTDRDTLTYAFSLDRKLEKGNFLIASLGGFEDLQFNGDNDGLSKYWSAKSTLDYKLAERLASSFYLLYRHDKYIELNPERSDDSYEGGCNLDWSFSRWYSAGIRYVYRKLESNFAQNSYDDHRLYLSLSATKELWRW